MTIDTSEIAQMGKLGKNEIQKLALEIIKFRPAGIRYSDLVREVAKRTPETPVNTIHGSTWNLQTLFPDQVIKPARGLFKVRNGQEVAVEQQPTRTPRVSEEEFYELFADYLQNDLEECTKALPLGGSGMRTKWGTPDVIGVYRPLKRDLVQFTPEIVAAEIKVDANQPVLAFGQAVAYRLFASRVYVVEPVTISPEDLSRLEALCMLFGVGLVLFDINPKEPGFSIRMRAQRFLPDMFYVNQFAERLKENDPDAFDALFG